MIGSHANILFYRLNACNNYVFRTLCPENIIIVQGITFAYLTVI